MASSATSHILGVTKGDRVCVEGRLKLDTWNGKDGKERSDLKVAAWKLERLGEIGRNKPAAQAKVDDAPAQARRDSNDDRRHWQRPRADGDEILF